MKNLKNFGQFLNENNRIKHSELKDFLTELGFKDMYMKNKNNPKKLEQIFNKILKGNNLKKFNKLINPPLSDKEKDDIENKKEKEQREKNIEKYNKEVKKLRELWKSEKSDKLVDKYIDVFNLDTDIKHNVMNYIFGFEGYEPKDDESDVIPREDDIIKDIATKVTGYTDEGFEVESDNDYKTYDVFLK